MRVSDEINPCIFHVKIRDSGSIMTRQSIIMHTAFLPENLKNRWIQCRRGFFQPSREQNFSVNARLKEKQGGVVVA